MASPRETGNNTYAKFFGGQTKSIIVLLKVVYLVDIFCSINERWQKVCKSSYDNKHVTSNRS